jgi:hypothetical protein
MAMPLDTDVVVLLGAGASQEAGIPTTFDMTEELVRRIDGGAYERRPVAAALNFICGALLAYDSASGSSPFVAPDVERVFAAVELLAERNTLEVSPFVASWHPAVDALDANSGRAPGSFDHDLGQALTRSPSFNEVERLLNDLIDARTGSAAAGKTYAELASVMLSELRDLVATTPKKASYLEPLARAALDRPGLTVASLNYDRSVEYASEAVGVPFTTGVESWLETGRWTWPESGLRLLKLHGSIDWVWGETEHRHRHLPHRTIRVVEDAEEATGQPAIVFGQRGKLRAKGPFLGLLTELEALMSTATSLIAIGYSFRDEHVNELITRWTLEDVEREIVVVDPDGLESRREGHDYRYALSEHLAPRPPHEDEIQQTWSRLEVRREKCSEALRRLF